MWARTDSSEGQRVMAGGTVRQKARRLGRCGASKLSLIAEARFVPRPAEAALLDRIFDLVAQARLDPQTAIGFALLMGLIIFATTTAILHLRERNRWAGRERALSAELGALRGAHDRAEM